MRKIWMRMCGILLLLQAVLYIPVFSVAGEAFEYLSAGELKEMIEQKSTGLVIIDSRSTYQFEEAHIRGAVHIPLGDMEQDETLPNFPKDSRLVFYCSGNT